MVRLHPLTTITRAAFRPYPSSPGRASSHTRRADPEPERLAAGAEKNGEAGAGAAATAVIAGGGTYGAVCMTGEWPEIDFVLSEPFEVAP